MQAKALLGDLRLASYELVVGREARMGRWRSMPGGRRPVGHKSICRVLGEKAKLSSSVKNILVLFIGDQEARTTVQIQVFGWVGLH